MWSFAPIGRTTPYRIHLAARLGSTLRDSHWRTGHETGSCSWRYHSIQPWHRDAYALIVADSLSPDPDIDDPSTNEITYSPGSESGGVYTPATASVKAKQGQANRQTGAQDIGGFNLAADKGGPVTWTVSVDGTTGLANITYSAS